MSDFNRTNPSNSSTMGSSGTTGSTGTMDTTSTRRFEDFRDTYRSDWENRFGKDRPWQQHEDAFRYGWHAAQHDRFKGRRFDDTQSDLQRDWANRYDFYGSDFDRNMYKTDDRNAVERTWDNFKDTVREGWERARMEFDKRF
jgi:hypothetical protein